MSIPEGGQDHAWVTDVLAADQPGPIPSHVADRVMVALGATGGAPPVTGPSGDPQRARRTVPPAAAVPPAAVPPAAVADSWHGMTGADGVASQPVRSGSGSSRVELTPGAPGGRPAPVDAETADGSRSHGVRILTGGRRSGRAEAQSDRRHFLLYRMAPVAAAMVVLAAASGVVATQVGGEEGDQATVTSARAETGDIGPRPNGLIATGTPYTTDSLVEQATVLLTQVAQGRNVAAQQSASAAGSAGAAGSETSAPGTAAPGAASADAGSAPTGSGDNASTFMDDSAGELVDPLTTSPLASAAAFRECARTLGAADGVLPAAVDLATFEGTEAAIVVLPNRAGDGYEVIVTDRFCNPGTERASRTFVGG